MNQQRKWDSIKINQLNFKIMTQIKKKSKAFEMLSSVKSVGERAEKYTDRIYKSISLEVLETLREKIEKADDEIFELSSFNLETNLNKGMKQLSKEDCENRFKKIIDLEYHKKLLMMELEVKQGVFDKLFK